MSEADFDAACSFVEGLVATKDQSITDAALLKFYGLYKQATKGPCTDKQPSIFNPKARAKWAAWQDVSGLSEYFARQQYIALLQSIIPEWVGIAGGNGSSTEKSKGMGPVFSSLVGEEEDQEQGAEEESLPKLCKAAAAGDIIQIDTLLQSTDIDVNAQDDAGCSALHWAADRGHVDVIMMLATQNADLNAVDGDGQTALHYAALSSQQAAAEALLHLGADASIRNSDGESAKDVAPENWNELFDSL